MYGRIRADNFFNTTIVENINDVDNIGFFTIEDKTVNGYTIEDGEYLFWMTVGLTNQNELEIFRIYKVNGKKLYFDKRISPNGKYVHPVGQLCVMTVASEFWNRLSKNVSDFGFVEKVANEPLKIKVYGGLIEKLGETSITIEDTILDVADNDVNYIYFDRESYSFKVSSDIDLFSNVVASVTTLLGSIEDIVDLRAVNAMSSGTPESMDTNSRLALTNVVAGTMVYDTCFERLYQYVGGGWLIVGDALPYGNATENEKGIVRLATDSEFNNGSNSGADGATLMAKVSQIRGFKPYGNATEADEGVVRVSTDDEFSDGKDVGDDGKTLVVKTSQVRKFRPYGNATDSVEGIVRIATEEEFNNGEDIGIDGNTLVTKPSQIHGFKRTSEQVIKEEDYTLTLNDAEKYLIMKSDEGVMLYIPEDSSVNFPIGTIIHVEQGGEGAVDIEGMGSVEINSSDEYASLTNIYTGGYIRKEGPNLWTFIVGSGTGGEPQEMEYDVIHTLTFNETGGDCNIILHRGSNSAFSGTVFYREGKRGERYQLNVSGTDTTFPVTSKMMQVGHDWNKNGNGYMTPSFKNNENLTGLSIKLKDKLEGVIGNYFFSNYANGCKNLASLGVPNTSGVTEVEDNFMDSYAYGCSNLTSLGAPNLTNTITIGNKFMYRYTYGCSKLVSLGTPLLGNLLNIGDDFLYHYAYSCENLTSLGVPNTSNVIKVGNNFMCNYASRCFRLASLGVPDTSNITEIGHGFLSGYAYWCNNLISLGIPDTSGITNLKQNFMNLYAYSCSSLTSLGVPDTSLATIIGQGFMSDYANGCKNLISLGVPNTIGMSGTIQNFMLRYANNCNKLEELILPKAGYFKDNNINRSVPASRLGILQGLVLDEDDVDDWKSLTVDGETLHTNYIRGETNVRYIDDDPVENPDDIIDVVHTLTFDNTSGDSSIRLYHGSETPASGDVYYRAGTSGDWTKLYVTGTDRTFPITSTTMQVGHAWNKDSSNNYMTPSFFEETKLTGLAPTIKTPVTGVVGDYFFNQYAGWCENVTTLGLFNTSGITEVGDNFMTGYANRCAISSINAPDTSNITKTGDRFLMGYCYICPNLISLTVPDTSNITEIGDEFLKFYAIGCSSLTSLGIPDVNGLVEIGDEFMNMYASTTGINSFGVLDISNVESIGNDFMNGCASGCEKLKTLGIPDTSSLTTIGTNFMNNYAWGCSLLEEVILPKVGWFESHNIDWTMPINRLGILQGMVLDEDDVSGRKALTVPGKTLHTNQIRNDYDVKWIDGGEIELTAVVTAANQTVKVNKYFANDFTVNRGDGSPVENVNGDKTKPYSTPGTYKIKLNLAGDATRWAFESADKPLVPTSGTTANNIYVSKIPPLARYFGSGESTPGSNFFAYFNMDGALTSLPAGSFNTSNITTVGDSFFYRFNMDGALTSLPAGSFNTSNITTVGDNYFYNFNSSGALTSLPAGSFNTSNITTVGDSFFHRFNSSGALTSLPAGSFDTSNITTVGDSFFQGFNMDGALTSLPAGSFNTSNITTVGDNYFLNSFNLRGKIAKQIGGIQIKNPSSYQIYFHYWAGSSSPYDTIAAGGTFNGYKVG